MNDRQVALVMAAILYPHTRGHEYERRAEAASLAMDLIADVFKAWDQDERVGEIA